MERAEAKKESEETQEVVELAKVEVNLKEEGDDLDLGHVRQGRAEDMNYMVKPLEMLDCGSWEEPNYNELD